MNRINLNSRIGTRESLGTLTPQLTCTCLTCGGCVACVIAFFLVTLALGPALQSSLDQVNYDNNNPG